MEKLTSGVHDPVYHDPNEANTYDSITPRSDSKDSGLSETPEDPAEVERQREEWKAELAKTEEEIVTLKTVLGSKVRHCNELKNKLGISPLTVLAHDVSEGIHKIQESNVYQKTNKAFKTAGEKTSAAVGAASATVGKKFSDLRNSDTFKSFEEKVGSAYSSVKAKVSSKKPDDETLDGVMDKEKEEGNKDDKAKDN